MHRNRHTKIVATLGPASSSIDIISTLFERGVDVFRLNFSHGNHETHAQNIHWIRQIEKNLNKPISILADLQGPKLRVGKFSSPPINITAGQKFIFDLNPEEGNQERVQLPHPEIFQAAKKGDELLVDDGKLAFRVDHVDHSTIKTTALVSGPISNNKGLNLPSTHLPIDILTEKDKADLEFALSKNVDFIALSFVQTSDDIIQTRKRIHTNTKIIAKLEKPQAIQNLTAILNETDAVMIARGDLGVELPPEQLPPLQRKILREAKKHKKPVIVATQMLESMINTPKPTRAEASDVATAVYLGTDAVMLSAESASGAYPKEAVEIMDRIIFHAEQDILSSKTNMAPLAAKVSNAAVLLAHEHNAKVILAISNSFHAFAYLSSIKTHIPVLALTSDMSVYRQLPLLYGVFPLFNLSLPKVNNSLEDKALIHSLTTEAGMLTHNGQRVVVLTQNSLDSADFSGMWVCE
ncbi:MAG: pyruvate kinase [Candidatus Paracaedibacteraceae bacterium]|nr:pyruvate kinase [Candidatus Paracaedibacteraceae bacterium]